MGKARSAPKPAEVRLHSGTTVISVSVAGINDRRVVQTLETSRFAAFLSPLRLRGRRAAAVGRRRSGRLTPLICPPPREGRRFGPGVRATALSEQAEDPPETKSAEPRRSRGLGGLTIAVHVGFFRHPWSGSFPSFTGHPIGGGRHF